MATKANSIPENETPSEDILKGMFEESMRRDPDKLGFSEEEGKKFGTAFADPEFRKMFGDYMDELQDPANRAETEAYISQLEGEQKVPEGKELIRPGPGFVAKTYKVDETAKDKKGDKLWMNVVSSDKITKPSSEKTDGGESWSVPYSLGPPHMEKDNQDNNVATFDCCFHPEALAMSKARKAFQNLLVQTAIEGVEESYKRQKLVTKVSKDFHVLKGVSYKSGIIGTMLVDKTHKANWDKGTPQEQRDSAAAKLAAKIAGGPKGPTRSKEEVAAAVAKAQGDQAAIEAQAAKDERKKWVDDMIAKETNGESINKLPAPAGSKKKGDAGIIKKGFLEGRGGTKAPERNPLIREISSTPAQKSPKKKTQQNAMPPVPPGAGEVDSEAAALAAKSLAEVDRVKKASAEQQTAARRNVIQNAGGKLEVDASASKIVQSSNGPVEPKYTVTERGMIEWGDFELSRDGEQGTSSSQSARPKEIVVKVDLPRVPAGQGGKVELDVSEKRVTLKFKEVYDLSFQLPYRVDDTQGAAKFDKHKSQLVVTLPLAKPTAEELERQKEMAQAKPVNVVDVKPSSSPKSSPAKGEKEESPTTDKTKPPSPKKKEKGSGKYVEGLSAEEKDASTKLKDEIAAAAKAAKAQAEKDAKDPVLAQKRREAAAKVQAAKDAKAAAAEEARIAAENKANAPPDTSVRFIASEEFNGAKPGYVFKRGDAGLGYHVDDPPHKAKVEKPVAAVKFADPAHMKKDNVVASASSSAVPTFQMRQTPQAVSVIIPMVGIDAAGVKVVFAESTVCCSFVANDVSYAFELSVPKNLLAKQKFDADKCRFDVAKKNMALVLVKASSCTYVWAEGDGILAVQPWNGAEAEAGEVSSPKKDASKSASQQSPSKHDVEKLVQQAGSMQFSSASNSAIYDLD